MVKITINEKSLDLAGQADTNLLWAIRDLAACQAQNLAVARVFVAPAPCMSMVLPCDPVWPH